jgi:drug/metabolite transporter (DMT)-like permease
MQRNPKLIAILQALLVTLLWSTSWVLIKFGLADIPALTFAGLRYFVAFLVLLPFYWRSPSRTPIRKLTRRDWGVLITLGLVYYTLTQGSQFLGLLYLPAITFSLLLNFTAPLTALAAIPLLKEKLTGIQWWGMAVFMAGVLIYFYPVLIPAGMALGLAIGVFNVVANSAAAIIGRGVNRSGRLSPLTITVVSMGIGAVVLLGLGLATEDFPQLSLGNWANIVWLAAVNTALAFTLWNHTLRTLTAAESSIINNTMLIQIAVLAWLFLGEQPGPKEWLGMAVVSVGVLMVNLKGK